MLQEEVLVFERTFNAEIEKVWAALTDEKLMRQWYFPTMQNFKAEVGFETQFNVSHNGKDYMHIWKVTQVEHMQRIAYSWRYGGYPGVGIVCFEIDPDEQRTKVKLTFTIVESFQDEKFPDFSVSNFHIGWTHFINSLEKFLNE